MQKKEFIRKNRGHTEFTTALKGFFMTRNESSISQAKNQKNIMSQAVTFSGQNLKD